MTSPSFEFFERDNPVEITTRYLPHWYQAGVTYFITFRTADSLPQSVLQAWLQERNEWLAKHGLPPAQFDWKTDLSELPQALRNEFHQRFSEAFHRYLDAGYGECVLRRPDLAQIVADSLLHFDGQRYHLGDFVIMPNHVHLLVCLLGDTDLKEQCYSWKKFTSTKIQGALGRHGHFWQGESFDHLVRSPEQFVYFQHYIADNPKRANLREGEYVLRSLLK